MATGLSEEKDQLLRKPLTMKTGLSGVGLIKQPASAAPAKGLMEDLYSPSADVRGFIREMEGDATVQSRSGAYRDGKYYLYSDSTGHTTIGIGHKLTKDEIASGTFREGISDAEAEKLYDMDLKAATKVAAAHFGKDGWAAMAPHQKDAAIDMAFNLGPGGLRKFPKWSRALRSGDWEEVYKQADRFYTSATGEKKPLAKRNAAYKALFVQPHLGEAREKEKARLLSSMDQPTEAGYRFGARSLRELSTVQPEMQQIARRALELSPVDFGVLQGSRSEEEQEALYQQGRTTPGEIVTWTRRSKHLSDNAIDIGVFRDGKLDWEDDDKNKTGYRAVHKAFQQAADELGYKIRWLGDSRQDYGHFELVRTK